MCSVSAIFDQYTDRWQHNYYINPPVLPTQQEIDEFRELLQKARQWDIENNQPDCETAEKRQKLKDLAEELGVEIEFI